MERKDFLFREDLVKQGETVQSKRGGRRGIKELSTEELIMLEGLYSGLAISAVEPLDVEERIQFYAGAPTFNFHIQTLYKCEGELEPSRLVSEIRSMIAGEERLRTNYCLLNGEMCRVILSGSVEMPNIICQDLRHLEQDELDITLERIMEADMHQEFNLQKGPLFRISSFRTGNKEYALLLTISKLIAPYFNIEKLLRRMAGQEQASESMTSGSMLSNSGFDRDDSALAEGMVPDQSLPYERTPNGDYCLVKYRELIPSNVSNGLLRLMSGSRVLLLGALETAWGLLLMENNSSGEACIPLLLSATDDGTDSFLMVSSSLRKDTDVSIEHTVTDQVAQLEDKVKAAGTYNAITTCGHFLSFYDFFSDRKPFSVSEALPQGNMIARNLWAASGIKLGVYFHWKDKSLSVTFIYDKSRFKPYSVELISQKYLQLLQKMLFDWKQPVSDFAGDAKSSGSDIEDKRVADVRDESRNGLYSIISELTFIKGVHSETLRRDIVNPRKLVLLKGDQIPRKDIEDNFIFVVDGRVLRSISSGGELYNYLDICTSDSWINESVLIPQKKSRLSVAVISEEATILLIPTDEMNRLMNDEPHIIRRMLLYSVSETDKYQRLWTQM